MKYQKEAESINNLVAIAEIKSLPASIPGISKQFSIGNQILFFTGLTNVKKFENVVIELYNKNNAISETYSLIFFENKIAKLIKKCVEQNINIKPVDIENLLNEIVNINLKEYEVIAQLFGCTLDKRRMIVGKFIIYNYNLSKEKLHSKYPKLEEVEKKYLKTGESNLYVSIKLETRDSLKAVENAELQFKTFENVINYVTGINPERAYRRIGVFNFNTNKSRHSFVLSPEDVGYKGEMVELSAKNGLQEADLLNESAGNNLIWGLLTKNNLSEIQKRILSSVEWIGRAIAISETDFSNALIQYVFAIEGMLKKDEHKMINPSITSQLSEWLAFILEIDCQKRIEISNIVKDLYTKRSVIAHGQIKIISQEDLKIALEISKRMIITLLTIEPYKSFNTMDELSKHIEKLRFS